MKKSEYSPSNYNMASKKELSRILKYDKDGLPHLIEPTRKHIETTLLKKPIELAQVPKMRRLKNLHNSPFSSELNGILANLVGRQIVHIPEFEYDFDADNFTFLSKLEDIDFNNASIDEFFLRMMRVRYPSTQDGWILANRWGKALNTNGLSISATYEKSKDSLVPDIENGYTPMGNKIYSNSMYEFLALALGMHGINPGIFKGYFLKHPDLKDLDKKRESIDGRKFAYNERENLARAIQSLFTIKARDTLVKDLKLSEKDTDDFYNELSDRLVEISIIASSKVGRDSKISIVHTFPYKVMRDYDLDMLFRISTTQINYFSKLPEVIEGLRKKARVDQRSLIEQRNDLLEKIITAAHLEATSLGNKDLQKSILLKKTYSDLKKFIIQLYNQLNPIVVNKGIESLPESSKKIYLYAEKFLKIVQVINGFAILHEDFKANTFRWDSTTKQDSYPDKGMMINLNDFRANLRDVGATGGSKGRVRSSFRFRKSIK